MSAIVRHPRRPQLTSDELLQLRWLLGGLLTLIGVSTVLYLDVDAWLVMGATLGVTIATLSRPALPARVPRVAQVLAFPVIAAVFSLDLWIHSELLPATVRLDLLLLLYRNLVYRQRRDDLQLIVLGLFLVVVAGVLTVSLAFAVQILAYTACALVFLFVITLAESAASAKGTEAPANGAASADAGRWRAPPWAAHANWPRLLSRVAATTDVRVAALSGALFLGVIVISGLLFLAIPRFQLDGGMFLDRFMTKKARTGFSDTIRFGDVTQIQQDTGVALNIDVSDAGQIPLVPYWRMVVLDEYRNGMFKLSRELRSRLFRRTGTDANVPGGSRHPGGAVWKFYLEAGVSRYLPLLGPFRELRFSEARDFQDAREAGLVALAKDPVSMVAYRVAGFDLSARLRDPSGSWYGNLSSSFGPTPAGAEDERTIRRLAAEASAGPNRSTAEFASRVCAWLRKRHAYSLSPDIPPGPGDPLVRWMASNGAGHCELFAGAFVLMARAAGYPSRVVTGFRGGAWNAFSNSFTVRNSDAHAWAEIYDKATRSWLRADPLEAPELGTAGAAGAAGIAGRTDRSWSARLNSLRVFWYRRIVSFDQQTQVHTFQAAKRTARDAMRRLRLQFARAVADVRAWFGSPWNSRRYVEAAGIAALLAGMIFGWARLAGLRFRIRCWLAIGGRQDPTRSEAGRWLRRIGEGRGGPPRSGLVRDLERLRFGARHTWPEAAEVFRRARTETRSSRRRR